MIGVTASLVCLFCLIDVQVNYGKLHLLVHIPQYLGSTSEHSRDLKYQQQITFSILYFTYKGVKYLQIVPIFPNNNPT